MSGDGVYLQIGTKIEDYELWIRNHRHLIFRQPQILRKDLGPFWRHPYVIQQTRFRSFPDSNLCLALCPLQIKGKEQHLSETEGITSSPSHVSGAQVSSKWI